MHAAGTDADSISRAMLTKLPQHWKSQSLPQLLAAAAAATAAASASAAAPAAPEHPSPAAAACAPRRQAGSPPVC